jgi:hypothetical protein
MDVVYPFKRQGRNEELRYSLRSLSNLPHDQVYISGDNAHWTRNVVHIPVPQTGQKPENSLRNIVEACKRPELSDDFILMNDDFFIMSPQQEVPHYHRGSLQEYLATFDRAKGAYYQLAFDTYELLRSLGIEDPLFYGIHIPTVLNKHRVLELVERFNGKPIMLRTLYHNIYQTGGIEREDVKKRAFGESFNERDFLSTSDAIGRSAVFRTVIQEAFPAPCYYELS